MHRVPIARRGRRDCPCPCHVHHMDRYRERRTITSMPVRRCVRRCARVVLLLYFVDLPEPYYRPCP
eukprot:13712336-Alexandrium_andersonii.AAC.1